MATASVGDRSSDEVLSKYARCRIRYDKDTRSEQRFMKIAVMRVCSSIGASGTFIATSLSSIPVGRPNIPHSIFSNM